MQGKSEVKSMELNSTYSLSRPKLQHVQNRNILIQCLG